MQAITGPSWDLSSEYPSPTAHEIDEDLERLSNLLDDIEVHNASLVPCIDHMNSLTQQESQSAIVAARAIHVLAEQASKLLRDPDTYAECLLSVDSQNSEAQNLLGKLTRYRVRFFELLEPASQFLDLASDQLVETYFEDPEVEATRFEVQHSRARKHEILSLSEENLASALSQDGIHAWGRLYDQLSGSITCLVTDGNEQREVGIAEAASLMMSTDDAVRQDAWRAINKSWSAHAETCAAAINAIAGWRLEMCRRRSTQRSVHYLDAAVHMNRMTRQTLDTVIDVAGEFKGLAQRTAKAMARAYGKQQIGPWDQRAPAPKTTKDEQKLPFAQGLDIVADAYGSVDPAMHDFVRMMADKQWIEGTVGGNKRPGAYCTSFHKSDTPRVYMTYSGSMSDVTVLAHELGHAFHHWTMRDLPDSQRSCGMSLAETASTFGETLVRDDLLQRARTPAEQLGVAWEEMSAINAFLLNIPTRYTFERSFYDARAERPLRTDELQNLMAAAWIEWHGDALSEPDDLFWVNKLHFYISGLSFYNFPYLFGYLFSQGIYQRRESMGDDFFKRYQALLMDTGRMSSEDLARTHLEVDLNKPDFWRETISALESRVDYFENLVESVTNNTEKP